MFAFQECYKEVITWLRLRHPNVLPFIGINRSLFRPRIALLSPWMMNGTSLMYLKNHPEASRVDLIHGVAKGLDYLHLMKPVVMHGDLRGSNVLIDDCGQPLISDFGLVRIEDSLASITASSFSGRGSLRWQAPELLCPDQFPDIPCNITTKSDVYSFACLCLEIFTGYPPFPHLREISVLNEVAILDRRPARPNYCAPLGLGDEMWTLMQWCWHRHPAVRPTMQVVKLTLQRLCVRNIEGGSTDSQIPPSFTSPTQLQHDRLAFSRPTHLPLEDQIIKTSLRCAELRSKLFPQLEAIAPSFG
ncbi:kinase-like protein [Schizopora paradoxa]|uniref:Kinase-like protein n=1 Tax=Schizopora paradoxa TaxID=27342 RepID=A0A0H2RIC4_9AGAM|nr:kinase-like protein [Schizopora paradoxa]